MAGTKCHSDTRFAKIVDPGAGTDVVQLGPFDLWWAAISAAEETIADVHERLAVRVRTPAWYNDHFSRARTPAHLDE